jgi:hypothetical protein
MKIGSFSVPQTCDARLRSLLSKEARRRYESAEAPLRVRLERALEVLARHRIDTAAALQLFARVDYRTGDDARNAWREAYRQLAEWCAREGIDPLRDTYWLEARHENHRNEVFEANRLSGRNDPMLQPSIRNVEALWDKIKLADRAACNPGEIEALCAARARRVWVLFWDVNLSGTTVAKELSRIARCLRILRPAQPTLVHVVNQLITPAARKAVRRAYAREGLQGRTFAACELGPHASLGGRAGSAVRERMQRVCRDFFRRVMRNGTGDARLRDVGPLGYRNGGLLLVRQENCPNNSLPLLWYVPDHRRAGDYAGPFARRFSTHSHRSDAPRDLDRVSAEQARRYARRVAELCAGRRAGLRTLAIRTLPHPYEDPRAMADAVLDLSGRFDGRSLRPGKDWRADVYAPLRSFLDAQCRDSDHIRLVLHAHASVAFAAGALLDVKSGKRVDVWQGGAGGARWWSIDDAASTAPTRALRVACKRGRRGRACVLAVGLTHRAAPEVRSHIGGHLRGVRAVIECEPAGGPAQGAVQGYAHGWRIAEQLVQQVRRMARESGVRFEAVHIFGACPNAVFLFLGRQYRALGACQLYEHDLEGGGGYTASLTVEPPRTGARAVGRAP